MKRVIALVYFSSLILLITFGSGIAFSRWADVAGPSGSDLPGRNFVVAVVVMLTGISIATGLWRFRRDRKKFWFGNILFVVWLPLSLTFVEAMCRRFVPAWPAQALHGVSPDVARSAWAAGSESSSAEINSWGQRDKERSILPSPDIFRVAFIGDSFLEESAQPVSLVTERLLNRSDVECINLGISSTQPDEYYYRLRSVAVPLGSRHCVVWLFSGNDFVDEPRTLVRRFGMFAVAPRPSWATAIALPAMNHLVTNNSRPVLQAWFSAGDLTKQESQMFRMVREADDDQLRNGLLNSSYLNPDAFANLQSRLTSAESRSFLAMLRQPDAGKFRSYYLNSGLWAASFGNGQWDPNPETHALYWAQEMQDHCQQRKIGLTFVVIPEAFQVDSRMQEQWAPLTDMRHLTKPCRDASERFCTQARQRGMDVLDLHSAFENVPGTYLNLDGHWSEKGVDLAAETVRGHLQSLLPSSSSESR